ncbi:hypothetical protein BJ138DRAFT_1078114 [Hygrophoropsis aurantiaca]|uniref:Uncharacterized protein n=1 Tax=Hygrophoropsis aurantiaca TaxID=72124 RepID=A0ACB8APX4_9AGAM|nr:hypothetical protein BJ138DRAFT_1078114 [Hygrophoropsis aurantiaca]
MASAADIEIALRKDEPVQNLDEFTLDPSDPLNLLLNSSTDSDTSSSQAPSPPDWSQFSSLWPLHQGESAVGGTENIKPGDFGMDFDFSLPMDLDFTSGSMSMAIDPNALHFDSKAIQQPMFDMSVQPQDLFAAPFSFTFSSPTLSTTSASSTSTDAEARRTSVSSEAPSGGPVMERDSAVVLQNNTVLSSDGVPKLPIPRLAPPAAKRINKSQPQPLTPKYQSSSASSSPSPGPGTPSSETGPIIQGGGTTSVTSRPKTSHTTIERRYRTNLNARIQSLKQTVPALRVLDPNHSGTDDYAVDERGFIDGVKVARKGSKANVLGKAVEYIRVLKRREARLKREQDGLRTLICGIPGGHILLGQWEQQWTEKFGGPEKDEIDNGAEAYEGSDEEDGDDDEGDDSERARKKPKVAKAPPVKKEKRKIAPAAPTPLPVTAAETVQTIGGIAVPEKRKRGRPRKIQPNVPTSVTSPSVVLSNPASMPQEGQMQMQMIIPQTHQPQQYLLAVFALFSFFNSPWTSFSSTSSPHTHTHTGSVLAHSPVESSASSSPSLHTKDWGWNDVVQGIHLLASVLILASIVIPWLPLPRKLKRSQILRLIPFSSAIYGRHTAITSSHLTTEDLPTPPPSPFVSDSESDSGSTTEGPSTRNLKETSRPQTPLVYALSKRGSEDEKEALSTALRLSGGFSGVIHSVLFSRIRSANGSERSLEQQAWTRLAELVVSDPPHNTPVATRLQIFLRFTSIINSSLRPSHLTNYVSDLCTSALLVSSLPFPFAQSRSKALWDLARAQKTIGVLQPYEHLVLDNLDASDAVECLGNSTDVAPIASLAASLVCKRLRAHLGLLFLQIVAKGTTQDELRSDKATDENEDRRRRETITAGRSLGGRPRLLVEAFEKIWESGVLHIDDVLSSEFTSNTEDDGIESLLIAIVLYRRIFPSQLLSCHTGGDNANGLPVAFVLSPPPSPPLKHSNSPKDNRGKDVLLQLRRALGSSVFDYNGNDQEDEDNEHIEFSLEDARDRVVDMLVDLERRERNRS